jgi:lysophospholipase L1-like esterase
MSNQARAGWRIRLAMLGCGLSLILVPVTASAREKQVWRDAFGSPSADLGAASEQLAINAPDLMKISPEAARAMLVPAPLAGTVRYRIKVSAAGSQIRVRISNEDGKVPLRFTAASVSLAGEGLTAARGSLLPLRFSGTTGFTIAPGVAIVSDPAVLPVSVGADLLVSVALDTPMVNYVIGGGQVAVAPGDQTLSESLTGAKQMSGRPLVTGVSVLTTSAPRVIVAFGDSISDGNRRMVGALHSWPEVLARRLDEAKKGRFTVVNAGIGGNQLLSPGWGAAGLARLDRDALRIEGLSHIVLLEGINDIGMSGKTPLGNNPLVTAEEIIAGYRQVITRAHMNGVKVIIGTLTPTGGSKSHSSPEKDAIRSAVNAWIRQSAEPDGIIDFDAVLRDPQAVERMNPAYDSGDHLHPNDAGYRAMGNAISLKLFH